MATHADTKVWQPTEAQRTAIELADTSMAVSATAGSGKTAVLIRRILRIIGAGPDAPDSLASWDELERILAITYTEKAAGEMRARLRVHVPKAERFRLDAAWIGTFHAFCARLIRRNAPKVGIDPSFGIMDENAAGLEARKAVHEVLLDLLSKGNENAGLLVDAVDFKTAVGALMDLMNARWHAQKALLLLPSSPLPRWEGTKGRVNKNHCSTPILTFPHQGGRNCNTVNESKWETSVITFLASVYNEVRKTYLDRLRRAQVMDFQELEIAALSLLEDKDIRDATCRAFTHILVDEVQDINDVQLELLKRLTNPKFNRIFIVGDEAQSIYRFRGANVGCFAKARELIEENHGKSIMLAENFRSRPEIISYVNSCQKILADGLFSNPDPSHEIIAARKISKSSNEPAVVELSFDADNEINSKERREKEAQAIATFILDLKKHYHRPYSDVVCLFRALTSSTPYETALRASGIPYTITGGRGLLQRQEIADLMAALRFAADEHDDTALLTLLRSPIIGFSDDELAIMAGRSGKELRNSLKEQKRCAILRELPRMARLLRPSEILRRVIDLSGYEYICDQIDPSGSMTANIDRFITVAAEIEREVPTPLSDFTLFIGEMRARNARLGDPPAGSEPGNAVRLMTVHAAKGLEFPVVILPDLFHLPTNESGAWVFSRGGSLNPEPAIAFKKKDELHPFGERIETERFTSIRDCLCEEAIQESKRLLYVAATRAEDVLVLPLHKELKDERTWHCLVRDALSGTHKFVEQVSAASLLNKRQLSPPSSSDDKHIFTVLPKAKDAITAHETTFTVSQLEAFANCPLRYSHQYILGLPSHSITFEEKKDVDRSVFGSIVHGVIERRAKNKEELHRAIRTECIANGIEPTQKLLKDASHEVLRAHELAGPAKYGEGMRELAFEWRVGNSLIVGSIDWLKPVQNNTLEVIDFKTGEIEAKKTAERAKEYNLQLVAYALAAESMTDHPVSATTIIFTGAGIVHSEPFASERRNKGRNCIEEIINIIAKGDFTPPKDAPCITCPYHHNGMCWEDKINFIRDRIL